MSSTLHFCIFLVVRLRSGIMTTSGVNAWFLLVLLCRDFLTRSVTRTISARFRWYLGQFLVTELLQDVSPVKKNSEWGYSMLWTCGAAMLSTYVDRGITKVASTYISLWWILGKSMTLMTESANLRLKSPFFSAYEKKRQAYECFKNMDPGINKGT